MRWTRPRVEELTVAEQKALPSFYEKWQGIALCTEPADHAAAEQGAVSLYQAFDLEPPKEFVWAKSIWEAYEQSRTADRDFASQLVGLWGQAHANLMQYYTASVLKMVLDGTNDYVVELWSPPQLLEAAHPPRKRIEARSGIFHICYGQDDAEWLGITEFFANIGVEFCKKLAPLRKVVASCGFVWFSPSKVAFFDRPKTIRLDDRRQLHCLDGPAIQFRDDIEAYAIHGVRIPKKYIEMPAEEIDLTEVLNETNAEVRMAAISKVGFSRLLETMKRKSSMLLEQTCPRCGEQIDIPIPQRMRTKGKSPVAVVSQANGNSLVEVNLGPRGRRNNDLIRFLHLTWRDKTGFKETVLPVPRTKRQFGSDCPENVNDCEQVRCWTLGWPKDVTVVAET